MLTDLTPSSPSPSNPDPLKQLSRMRLNFLDGIRGAAACYVMLAHVYGLSTAWHGVNYMGLDPRLMTLLYPLSFGHYAVSIFIVLSGFCLMLPVAKSNDRYFSDGLVGFFRRRARRILPPYYVALTLLIGILIASHHFLKHADPYSADLSAGDVLSHYFLINNLFSKYSSALDGPMWSVAWEWQIYFIFALLLLPVWRRFGIACTLAFAFVIGLLPLFVLPSSHNFNWMSPYYTGLFSAGMAGAVVLTSSDSKYDWAKNPKLLRVVLALTSISVLIMAALFGPFMKLVPFVPDTLIAVAATTFIIACVVDSERSGALHHVVRVLESKIAMLLGSFSYSLYLVHYPVLLKLAEVMHGRRLSHDAQFVIECLVGVPASLGLAYGFHLVAERPFMPGSPRTADQAEIAVIISPAP
jgi:peptidoglycan/LPS O-acetylase OafA/YrhL